MLFYVPAGGSQPVAGSGRTATLIFAAPEREVVYSLNVAVPGRVHRLAADLYPELVGFERIREDHAILLKRLGDGRFPRIAERTREALAGAPAGEARITDIDYFTDPPRGSSPVVYLAVESPALERIHRQLVDALGAADGLEGPDYTLHVTLARDGDLATAQRLADREIEPIEWTVSACQFYDAVDREVIRRVPLPA